MKRRYALLAGLMILPLYLHAEERTSVITPVANTAKTVTGEPIEVVTAPKIRTTIYELPPGKKLPVHKHAYQRLAYILSGKIDLINVDQNTNTPYQEGDFLVESRDSWHYGDNPYKEPVKLLVFDILPRDEDNNVIPKDPKTSAPPQMFSDVYATTMAGQPIHLPGAPEIRSLIYKAEPKINFPVHKHPYPRILYILSGEMDIIDSETHRIYNIKAGKAFVESVDLWHHGENNSDEPVKMLVIDFVPPGTGNNITLKDATH